jgi:hypothetical protein
MAISGKYGKVEIPKVGENERVFIFRAQDQLAAAAIELHRALVVTHGASLADSLQKEIDAFRSWPGRKKIPDLKRKKNILPQGRTGGMKG